MKKRKAFLARIPPDLKEKLDYLRNKKGFSVNFIVNQAIYEWLKRRNIK